MNYIFFYFCRFPHFRKFSVSNVEHHFLAIGFSRTRNNIIWYREAYICFPSISKFRNCSSFVIFHHCWVRVAGFWDFSFLLEHCSFKLQACWLRCTWGKITLIESECSNIQLSISCDLHRTSIDMVNYTSYCHERPHDRLSENELKKERISKMISSVDSRQLILRAAS